LRRTGWLKLFRSERSFANGVKEVERASQFGVPSEVLKPSAIAAREPHLSGDFTGAIYLPTPGFVPDPGALAKAYTALFKRKGGRFLVSDAKTLEQDAKGWRVRGAAAREAVVALGPWSDLVFRRLGYSIPLGVKRGYHLHLAPGGNAVLHEPVLDSDLGFVLAPMNRGIRLTRRRICPPRCAADAGPGPTGAAAGTRPVPAGRGDRCKTLDGRAAVPARYASGDRPGASPCRAVV